MVACGRRFGKTTLGIDCLIAEPVLRYPLGWFSPTYKMLLEVWRELVTIVKPIISRQSVTERRLELITGGTIELWSLDNPDAARGRAYKRIVVDEAAMVRDLGDAWNQVLRPTLADYSGDAWFLSTPKGHNTFWQMYQWGQDDQINEWRSWQMPTAANPYIGQDEIDAMAKEMPERIYRQEILAEFIEDGGGVFKNVAGAATSKAISDAQDGRQYAMGVDWGRHNDFTVFSVFDVQAKRQVYLDRFTAIDYEIQTSRLRNVIKRFKPTIAVVEYNSMGGPIIERLQVEGLPIQGYTTTNKTKEMAIRGLENAFDRGEITILPDPVQVGELQAYEQDRLPAGGWRFGAPDGMHDDTVMAMALAWTAIRQSGPVVLW